MKDKKEEKRQVIDFDNLKFTKPASSWVDAIIRDGKSNLKRKEQSKTKGSETE